MKRLKTILLALGLFFTVNSFGQNSPDFNKEKFPAHLIDTLIIQKRGLENQIKMLTDSCKWNNRTGKKIDVFWLRTQNGDFWGHVYEYFLDCDNLRLIYWYTNPSGTGKIVDFMIENLEDESDFVVAKRKHLKNKKQYQELLNH